MPERLRRQRIDIRSTLSVVQLRPYSFGGYAFGDAGECLRRKTYAFSDAERINQEPARDEVLLWPPTPSALRWQRLGTEKQSLRTSDIRGRIQERDVEGYGAADDSSEATVDWIARIPARADCSETRFPPVGMELVLGRCAGREIHLLFECESVNVSKEEEASFGALFKHNKSSKNGYKTRDYKDRYRRNVAVALIQLLQPHRTTYITSWQVGFVELALSGAPIHLARILWKATRQHAFEEKGVLIHHLSPFLLNFYRSPKGGGRTARSTSAAEAKVARRSRAELATRCCCSQSKATDDGALQSTQVEGSQARLASKQRPNGARTPLAEARRPLGQGRQHAAPTNVPTTDRCFASEQVPFDDSTSGQEPSAQRTSGQTPLAEAPSAQAQCEGTDEGWKEETRVPSAQAPSAIAYQTGGADLSRAGQPTALDILAGSGAAAAAAEATQPNSRESPRNSVATEILNSEDDEDESSSEEQEEELVQGMPIGVLCEQVVPLLRYLDRKVAKYGDPRHPGSYVELVRKRTRTKVSTSRLLASLDEKIKGLRLKNDALRGHLAILRKLQKAVNKTRDEKLEEVEKEFAKQREKLVEDLDSEQAQNRILSDELVRQTRLLEQCQSARQADKELIHHLQSQCGELRAQRAESELQLVD
ncbi:hypothetical protein AXG93_1096s1020 [Marchantia polymorpha subsp. ruderalis]|uniref:Uncharacterized protein n=1 Tax=Marchantia polymorpha subsp. ruderalis TaxID=1480154 RepID=A0A176VHY5_MARPO|nr:hypothetical protein AXG93_1096s1020 [Marchantia polymorpha subsp. ruderalis]